MSSVYLNIAMYAEADFKRLLEDRSGKSVDRDTTTDFISWLNESAKEIMVEYDQGFTWIEESCSKYLN
jgi:hypothetical protein